MGSEGWELAPHLISTSATVLSLMGRVAESTSENVLPDLWSEQTSYIHNRVTPSTIWYEWQDPSRKVIDATKEGHLRFVTIYSENEYIVALVKDGDREYGMPIEIPRIRRLPASEHFQKIFPERIISQIRHLETGADASNVVFDGRSFRHLSAPLFVELSAKRVLGYVPSDGGEEGGSGEGGGINYLE